MGAFLLGFPPPQVGGIPLFQTLFFAISCRQFFHGIEFAHWGGLILSWPDHTVSIRFPDHAVDQRLPS